MGVIVEEGFHFGLPRGGLVDCALEVGDGEPGRRGFLLLVGGGLISQHGGLQLEACY